MGLNYKQPGFSGGIISPQLLGRSDQQKYAMGLALCENAWITRYGTLENRPGTIFDAAVKDSTKRVRLVPFVFSNDVSYLLEFGENYVRPFKDGARISVVGASGWAVGATYAQGDLVTYLGVVYRALIPSLGDTPSTSPTIWNPQAGGLLEIKTDMPQVALPVFQYVQVNDIMTVAAHAIAPHQLLRFSDTDWQWQEFALSTGIDAPTGVIATAGIPFTGAGTPTGVAATGGTALLGFRDWYRVAAFDSDGEGVASTQASVGLSTVASGAFPITVTWNAVGGAVGYCVFKERRTNVSGVGALGMIALLDSSTLAWVDDDSLTRDESRLSFLSSAGNTEFRYVVTAVSGTTGIESLASDVATCNGSTPSEANPNVIAWDEVDGAAKYNVYRYTGGVPGFIGSSVTLSFDDVNYLPDTSIQPPTSLNLFETPDDWPACIGYYQQRLLFGNTINQPQTVWMSRVGQQSAFTTSIPTQDTDAIQFVIAGRQSQPVQSFVDLGKLVIHTASAEYVLNGNQAGTVTPDAIGLIANGSSGSVLILPITIGNSDLFIQHGATRLLDLRYNVQSFSYDGKDLTKFAADLFQGRTIVDMTWQKLPHSIVWLVLDNGTIIALTYVREDEMWAWHQHVSSNGHFENVCVVQEGDRQTLYTCVRRTINGSTKRYIEQLASRECLDTVLFTDAIFADSSLTYDGRNQTATTVAATTGAGWTTLDLLTLTASAPSFAPGIVGDQIVFQQYDDDGLVSDLVSFQITGRTSDTVVAGNALREVPAWARATPIVTWGTAVTDFSGIDHLEGESLSILADGNVAANPLNDDYPQVTVSGGSFSLTEPAMVVTAGLPLVMQVQTLPLENAQGTTIINHRLTVRRCTPIFHNSRGGNFGQDFDHLQTWKQPNPAPMGYPVAGITGPSSVPINGTPSLTGQICIQLDDPVPFGMSGVVMSGELGDAT